MNERRRKRGRRRKVRTEKCRIKMNEVSKEGQKERMKETKEK
jgi:hypothetical protein